MVTTRAKKSQPAGFLSNPVPDPVRDGTKVRQYAEVHKVLGEAHLARQRARSLNEAYHCLDSTYLPDLGWPPLGQFNDDFKYYANDDDAPDADLTKPDLWLRWLRTRDRK